VTVPLLLLLQAATLDWATLPELAYRNPPAIAPNMVRFVIDEIRKGRCKVSDGAKAAQSLAVDVAVLVEPDGTVRSVVPRSIQCPNIEQYTAGLVTAFTRNNLMQRGAQAEQWYRASVTFSWKK
jgi:hypothetical protein